MDVIINGGTLRSDNEHEVVANVEYVLQKACVAKSRRERMENLS